MMRTSSTRSGGHALMRFGVLVALVLSTLLVAASAFAIPDTYYDELAARSFLPFTETPYRGLHETYVEEGFGSVTFLPYTEGPYRSTDDPYYEEGFGYLR